MPQIRRGAPSAENLANREPTSNGLSGSSALDWMPCKQRSSAAKRASAKGVPPPNARRTIFFLPGSYFPSKMALQVNHAPKNRRSRKAMEDREPKLVENTKTAMFIKGIKSSQTIQSVLTDLVRFASRLVFRKFVAVCNRAAALPLIPIAANPFRLFQNVRKSHF